MMQIKIKSHQRGLTVFELLFVFAIAAMILLMGLRQYQILKKDNDILQLQANVDSIFSALAMYYKQNCYGQFDPQATPPSNFMPGKLHPNADPAPTMPYMPVSLQNDLVTPGFLSTTLPTILPLNPLVNATPEGTRGYVSQFNYSDHERYMCLQAIDTSKPATGYLPSQNCSDYTTMGYIISWRPQVAVHMKDPDTVNQYAAILGADCISSLKTGQVDDGGTPDDPSDDTSPPATVYSCRDTDRVPGDYLVWERSPSQAAGGTSGGFWQMMPTVQQFNQMYSTYPITYLLQEDTISNTTGYTPYGKQYFLCGD